MVRRLVYRMCFSDSLLEESVKCLSEAINKEGGRYDEVKVCQFCPEDTDYCVIFLGGIHSIHLAWAV